ncbi:hypothetical protein ACKUG4_00620 [Pseudomonas glycinae]|uniref:hypothetical protein n=2 Tax=Pseudomonas TaxID=286 RepID=UPI00117AB21D|nr:MULTISPECIES: hypothetical protein [Pseudomonas]
MPPLLRRAWRFLRGAKATAYVLLMLGPMFIKPLAFVRVPHEAQPIYAKLPGLWGTPLLVAGVVAATIRSFYQWVFWREMNKSDPSSPAADLLLMLHNTEGRYFWFAFVFSAVLVYALAGLRWSYHFGAISFIRRWRPNLSNPPLKYFVVTTAAWGLWLSLYSAVVVYGLWQWKAQVDLAMLLNQYVEQHQTGVLVTLLGIGVAMRLAGRNGELGMKALYGGSKWLSMAVSLVAICALLLLAFLLSSI